MLSIWLRVVSMFQRKQAELEAEVQDEMPISIKNALNGNWDLVKPSTCQPPPSHEGDEEDTYQIQQLTDNQLDTMSVLSCSASHDYSTAAEKGDHDRSELEFLLAERLVEELPDDVDIPEKMCEDFIFCTSKGQFRKIRSALKWIKNERGKDRLDCEAQISMKDMTDNPSVDHTHLTSCTVDTTAETTADSVDLRTDSSHTLKQNVEANSKDSMISENIVGAPLSAAHKSQGEISKMSAGVVETVNDLIDHIEHLLDESDKDDELSEVTCSCNSTSNKPVKDLSPSTKKEVHSLLQETAEALEVNNISMDPSLSSIQLLHSIINEAGRQFGFSDHSWAKKLTSVNGGNLSLAAGDVDLTTNCLRSGRATSLYPGSAGSSTVDVIHPKITKSVGECNTASKSVRSERTSKRVLKKSSSTLTTTLQQKSAVTKSNQKGVKSSKKLHPTPSIDDFRTCRQVIQDNRGVKASVRSLANCRYRCNCKALRKPVEKKGKIPLVDEYKVSTKTGAHSFYEVMKAKLTMPENPARKTMVGPTVPKPLQSTAIWTNGELSVIVKEIDKDLAHLPSSQKDLFSGLPGAITIEYAREYREDKIGQKSPSMVRKTSPFKCVSPGREKLLKHFESKSKPFNTKVDYILKKEPLVLGTVDRKSFCNKKTIESKTISKTRIPAYCVV